MIKMRHILIDQLRYVQKYLGVNPFGTCYFQKLGIIPIHIACIRYLLNKRITYLRHLLKNIGGNITGQGFKIVFNLVHGSCAYYRGVDILLMQNPANRQMG